MSSKFKASLVPGYSTNSKCVTVDCVKYQGEYKLRLPHHNMDQKRLFATHSQTLEHRYNIPQNEMSPAPPMRTSIPIHSQTLEQIYNIPKNEMSPIPINQSIPYPQMPELAYNGNVQYTSPMNISLPIQNGEEGYILQAQVYTPVYDSLWHQMTPTPFPVPIQNGQEIHSPQSQVLMPVNNSYDDHPPSMELSLPIQNQHEMCVAQPHILMPAYDSSGNQISSIPHPVSIQNGQEVRIPQSQVLIPNEEVNIPQIVPPNYISRRDFLPVVEMTNQIRKRNEVYTPNVSTMTSGYKTSNKQMTRKERPTPLNYSIKLPTPLNKSKTVRTQSIFNLPVPNRMTQRLLNDESRSNHSDRGFLLTPPPSPNMTSTKHVKN